MWLILVYVRLKQIASKHGFILHLLIHYYQSTIYSNLALNYLHHESYYQHNDLFSTPYRIVRPVMTWLDYQDLDYCINYGDKQYFSFRFNRRYYKWYSFIRYSSKLENSLELKCAHLPSKYIPPKQQRKSFSLTKSIIN